MPTKALSVFFLGGADLRDKNTQQEDAMSLRECRGSIGWAKYFCPWRLDRSAATS